MTTTWQRRSSALLSVVVLVAVPALAACGANGVRTASGGTSSSTRTPTATATVATPSATPTAAPTATPTTRTTATGAPSATAAAVSSGTGVCSAAALRVGWDKSQGGAAMGSDYILLTFKNASTKTCYLDGHPGVSFVGRSNGTQLGAPAVRTGSIAKVVLAPGRSTSALLQIAEAANYDASTCKPTTADGFRVYPPGSYASVFVPFRTQACQGDVGAAVDSPQMTIWPTGHSG